MKRVLLLVLMAVGISPAVFAQGNDHVQLGIYADYFRMSQTDTDFAGLGGRLAFAAYRQLKLESEMSYDLKLAFHEGFTDDSTVPPTVTVAGSNTRALHGLFGPKLELGHSSFHPFVAVKAGFADGTHHNLRVAFGPYIRF